MRFFQFTFPFLILSEFYAKIELYYIINTSVSNYLFKLITYLIKKLLLPIFNYQFITNIFGIHQPFSFSQINFRPSWGRDNIPVVYPPCIRP